MDTVMQVSGLAIGIVGWVGTVLLLMRVERVTHVQKRAMVILAWLVWMLPAFESVVRRGVLTGEMALQYCCALTVMLALGVLLSALPRRTRQ